MYRRIQEVKSKATTANRPNLYSYREQCRHENNRHHETSPRQYVTFPPHVTLASAIKKGKWLEWCDAPERTDSSGSNRPVEPDLDLDGEESFIVGRLVSADVIEHETDHAPDYGDYGVISGRLALS
jgi:hypothetical protein